MEVSADLGQTFCSAFTKAECPGGPGAEFQVAKFGDLIAVAPACAAVCRLRMLRLIEALADGQVPGPLQDGAALLQQVLIDFASAPLVEGGRPDDRLHLGPAEQLQGRDPNAPMR